MRPKLRCWSFSILLYFFSIAVSANDGYLFTVSGSNTVGAKLAPSCAVSYLDSLGLDNSRIIGTQRANEYEVVANRGEGFDFEEVKIAIKAHGSSTGFKSLLSSGADLAMSSRPIKDAELIALQHLGDLASSKSENTIAIDGLAIIVHPSNPVNQLTVKTIAKLFAGEITRWSELGGVDIPVSLYARDNNSGTWDTFKSLVLGGGFSLDSNATRFESNDELSKNVSADRGAIGFVGLASVLNAKLLAVSDGESQSLIPDQYTVATEDYPLSRRLYFYLPQVNDNHFVEEFVHHCQSQIGQDIVEKVGFVSQNITRYKPSVGSNAPEEYRELAAIGQRLSVNFRFDQGSPELDNKAYRDIERLVSFMGQELNSDLRLYLIGFSDAGERISQDLLLSRFRALAVRRQLLHTGVSVFKSLGFGSYLPVASNDNEVIKMKNGRVEVWVVDKKTL
jgi:phosphate transport system substrate-binding protein